MSSSAVRCDLCNVELSSEVQLNVHVNGKKHQKKVNELQNFSTLAKRSVFISGVPKSTFISEQQVRELMQNFGDIDRVLLDLKKGTYAIVEFNNELSARKAIEEGRIRVNSHYALIKERKMEFDNTEKKFEKESIDVDKLIGRISTVTPSYSAQIDELIRDFCLSEEQVSIGANSRNNLNSFRIPIGLKIVEDCRFKEFGTNLGKFDLQLMERSEFAKILTNALRDYFTPEVYVCVFGSSITSIGTVDSDIDASVLFEGEPLLKSERVNPFARNKFTLMTAEMSTIRSRKVCADEIARLTPADRIRFLTRILNDIRRCGTAPVSDQYPVLDARCPLVRFLFNRKHTFDLSVDNRLGITKSCWIKELIAADSSSNLRRFLIAVRFWAHVNGLMRKDEKTVSPIPISLVDSQRSHLNAYIWNMLSIVFLQVHSLLAPVNASSEPIYFDGWQCDFIVNQTNFSNLNIKNFLKIKFQDLFVWFVQLKLRDHVLCPRLGVILTKEQFSAKFPQKAVQQSFKFATLNIQDPFELSHNISNLVSEKYLTAMRREMMLTITVIKENPNNFVAALRQDSVASSHYSNDLEIVLPCGDINAVDCMNILERVLVELLLCDTIDEPKAKLTRKDMTSYQHEVSKYFEITQRVWIGRRNKRRFIVASNPGLSDWQIEKAVSKAICEDNSSDVSLRFYLMIVVENGNAEIRLARQWGNEHDLHNFSHFLSLFLPKYFSESIASCGTVPMEQ
ncbi:unnamed protein product [Anisakis simplex]|uniref:RRM domain-containing protein n=1 Tax=Anisakis simplex TaxID=6269 RepID=A0A0M3JVE2_ANISI|nr:unnamed protein product [Anisakis simplex]